MTISSSYEIRARLDHPVIDADGHTSEYLPAFAEYLREVGISSDFNELFRGVLGATADWYDNSPDERRRKHLTKSPWWTRPMSDARDRAAACFPRYLRERMDELGCDVSIVYPSTGLAFLQLPNQELRRGGCRALNRYHRDAFEGCTDRLIYWHHHGPIPPGYGCSLARVAGTHVDGPGPLEDVLGLVRVRCGGLGSQGLGAGRRGRGHARSLVEPRATLLAAWRLGVLASRGVLGPIGVDALLKGGGDLGN